MKVEITITDCPNKKELLKILGKITIYVKNEFPDNGKTSSIWNNNRGIVGKSDTKITYPE